MGVHYEIGTQIIAIADLRTPKDGDLYLFKGSPFTSALTEVQTPDLVATIEGRVQNQLISSVWRGVRRTGYGQREYQAQYTFGVGYWGDRCTGL